MTPRSAYSVSGRAIDALVKRAAVSAGQGGREICGLLAARANVLTPILLTNKAKRGGRWAFYFQEVRRVVAEVEREGGDVVGTFHSHPLGLPMPGPSDIANATHGSLMLIIDCLEKKCGLWRIGRGKATRVRLLRRQVPRARRRPGRP